MGSGKLDLLPGAKAEGPLFPWKWKVIDPEPVAQKAADYYVTKAEYDKLQNGGKFAGFNCCEASFAAPWREASTRSASSTAGRCGVTSRPRPSSPAT